MPTPDNYQFRNVRERTLTAMFDECVHIPTYDGTPVGLPTDAAPDDGPIAIDNTNDIFYFYSGSAWHPVSGLNFANADLTFTGDRTHELDGHSLLIQDGNNFINLNPISGNEFIELGANNGTGFSGVLIQSNIANGYKFGLQANDGVNDVQILANAATGTISLSSPVTTISSEEIVMDGRLEQTQGGDVTSLSGAISVGTDGNAFELTGTNTITLISNVGWQNGSEITFVFTSTATLTDGTANSGTDIGMELAGGANFTGSADDVITLLLCEIGGTQRWREKCRSVN
jgi:hypothetical protein